MESICIREVDQDGQARKGHVPSSTMNATMNAANKPNRADILTTADRIAHEVIAPHAHEVDAHARFPEASIDALSRAGLLGLISSTDVGGMGEGPREASAVIRRIAQACGSTAMVLTMHYCGVAVLEKHGPEDVRADCATGKQLSTLAFSEAGSRSHFWAPLSTARKVAQGVQLDAKKSWVTSAHRASAIVWSSKPVASEGQSTIWLVPGDVSGLHAGGEFDGIGLRGNDSSPMTARGAVIPESARLGEDGGGFDVMMGIVLPIFQLLNASCSLGLMESAVSRTITHVSGTKLEHLDSALRELPTIRAYVSRMKIETDMVACLVDDTIAAMEAGREDAMLRVLQCKAAAGESATRVLDTAMRVCGGAAFRKDVGVERLFRDGRAAGVMAPTTDALYDFIGKALTGMDLFG